MTQPSRCRPPGPGRPGRCHLTRGRDRGPPFVAASCPLKARSCLGGSLAWNLPRLSQAQAGRACPLRAGRSILPALGRQGPGAIRVYPAGREAGTEALLSLLDRDTALDLLAVLGRTPRPGPHAARRSPRQHSEGVERESAGRTAGDSEGDTARPFTARIVPPRPPPRPPAATAIRSRARA
jgi:hypothetical protein